MRTILHSSVVVAALLGALSFASRSEAGRILRATSGQRYELGRLVGKGGFGHVYRAWKVGRAARGKLARRETVAIKEYESLAGALEEHEAQKGIAGLSHLPKSIDDGFDEKTQRTFLASKWVEGRTLSDWIKAAKPDVREMVTAVAKASRVVDALHARGWLHLDLKPQNMMIDGHGRVTVIDLGLAQKKDATGIAQSDGSGTREFMAPEQLAEGLVDARADVFALAGTLYRLVTDKNPVSESKGAAGIAQHLHRIEDEGLRAIVAKGLAEDPTRRYANAVELAQALEAWRGPR